MLIDRPNETIRIDSPIVQRYLLGYILTNVLLTVAFSCVWHFAPAGNPTLTYFGTLSLFASICLCNARFMLIISIKKALQYQGYHPSFVHAVFLHFRGWGNRKPIPASDVLQLPCQDDPFVLFLQDLAANRSEESQAS